ncbi:MAG: DNA internalization-related competence protein ComEC/Rec2 [Deltaproteobacteria bacterium]|nr:DNA internalization-related competence protein ComEC/Rec2 [Deltaproteobacteria bacterium]
MGGARHRAPALGLGAPPALAAGAAWAIALALLSRAPCLTARFDARRLALALALIAAAAYALLAGLATPALRSLAMLACLAAAVALRRASSSAHALSVAALLVLVAEPAALFAPGAQFSFAATAALVLGAATHGERARSRAARGIATTLSTTALATLATAPIAALHFGAAPPLAGVANLAAVPLTGFVLMPAAFLASAAAFAGDAALASFAISGCAALAERALDAALAVASLAPRVAPQPPHALALACALAALALGMHTRRLAVRLACALAAQAALAYAPAPAIAPPAPRIVFLDVGHGDATLVQARGFSLLVDAGGASPDGWDAGASIVVPALAALGVRELDALAVSHADLDHRGGAPSVLDTFRCRELWLPHGARAEPGFAALAARARKRGVRVRERGLGDAPIVRAGVRVAPLWPPRDAARLGDNDRSLVLRVELAGLSALLLGDLEARGEERLLASGARLRADVLKLAHHGSRSSTTHGLLDAVQPRLAIASAPLAGRFGWPHASVRERVAARGARLAWTGRDGALLVSAGARCMRAWRDSAEACRALAVPP